MPQPKEVEKPKSRLREMLNKMSPSARKMAIEKEKERDTGSQVVQNEYKKAVANGTFKGTIEDFARERGMKLHK